MVRPADESQPVARMVELRAVQPAFPLYGSIELEGGQPYSHALLENHGALVRPELLTALGVTVGDRIVIGQAHVHDPRRHRERAGPAGRRVQPRPARAHRLRRPAVDRPARLRQPRAPRAAREGARRPHRAAGHGAATRTSRTSSSARARTASTDDQVGRDFDRAENYLSLVGLIIVILGGIAVSSVTRVFVLQKMRSIAVLKCSARASRADHRASTCCRW